MKKIFIVLIMFITSLVAKPIDGEINSTNEDVTQNLISEQVTCNEQKNIAEEVEKVDEKQEQENIFDRFYRVDKSRNKETGGVGLGLAIAKSIANVNGAEIKLESELEKGSKFIIIFKETNLK